MGYLLDTHIVIWLAYSPQKITFDIEQILQNRRNKVYFSTVNIWEVAIKSRLGKLDIVGANAVELYHALVDSGYEELKVNSTHCFKLQTLPLIHNDPFDRLLISQAKSENLILISHDKDVLKYDCIQTLNA